MSIIKTTIINCRQYIKERKSFEAPDLRGENLKGGIYAIFSYTEPIACYIPHQGWYVTSKYFSKTTASHTNIVRSVSLENPHELIEEIRTLIINTPSLL